MKKLMWVVCASLATLVIASAAMAASLCNSGEAEVCFCRYEGPAGGWFNFPVTMANGETCTVEMQVTGNMTAEELAELFAAAMDAFCSGVAWGWICPAPHDNCVCVRQPPDEDPVAVSEIHGTNPDGRVSGFTLAIIKSPATAHFDFAGATSSGTAMVFVGTDFAVTGTDGKTLDTVKNELVAQLVSRGHNAFIDGNGAIQVDGADADAGVKIIAMDPAFVYSTMDLALLPGDEDEDGD